MLARLRQTVPPGPIQMFAYDDSLARFHSFANGSNRLLVDPSRSQPTWSEFSSDRILLLTESRSKIFYFVRCVAGVSLQKPNQLLQSILS